MTLPLFFNQAQTSYPKPDGVYQRIQAVMKSSPLEFPELLRQATLTLREFFNVPETDQFFFTSGATAGLSVLLNRFDYRPGAKVLISHMEHHGLSSVLENLQSKNCIELVIIPRGKQSPLDLDWLEEYLNNHKVDLIALTTASNVTGELLPISAVAQLAHTHQSYLLLDGSQTVGWIPYDFSTLGADAFVFAGHKGILGPQGVGGLYLSQRFPISLKKASCTLGNNIGNTDKQFSSSSCSIILDYCDLGSSPIWNICGLEEAVKWHMHFAKFGTLAAFKPTMDQFYHILKQQNWDILGSYHIDSHLPTFSLTFANPDAMETKLKNLRIYGNRGQHCSPLTMAAFQIDETIRLSLAHHHKEHDLKELSKRLSP